jgi:hypothetical protein
VVAFVVTFVALSLAGVLVHTAPLGAQTVSGIVRDRVTGDGLAEVRIKLVAPDGTLVDEVRTDEHGRFGRRTPEGRVTEVVVVEAPGYEVWTSPPLDPGVNALEVRMLPVGVSEARIAAAEAAAAAITRRLTEEEIRERCGSLAEREGTGIVAGRIVDRQLEEGLPGVPVTVSWGSRPDPDRRLVIGGRVRATSRRTTSAAGGTFELCGLPAGIVARITAEAGGFEVDSVAVTVEEGAVHRVELTVALSRPGEPAGLFGTVVDAETGAPVTGARVSTLQAERWTLTNDRGFFALDSILAGRQLLRLDHLAYGTVEEPIVLEAGQAGEVRVELAPEALELEGVKVAVRPHRRLREMRAFDRRRATGFGDFFTAEELVHHPAGTLGDLLMFASGITVRRGNGPSPAILTRARGRWCRPMVFVNGVEWRAGDPLNAVMAVELEGVEIYRGQFVPAEYVDPARNPCVTVLAWTRLGV